MTSPLQVPPAPPPEEQPTQVQRPWRATLRTVSAAVWGLIPLWPMIVRETGLSSTIPWVATSLVITGAITRITSMPRFEAWMTEWLPAFSADPSAGARHRRG